MKHLLSVITILLAFACCTTEAERSRMSALLDRADSMNRAYIPMTDGIDSLLLEATHFYDRHGTANEQMRAHYLLGCAYRDKGEAPAALQSYQDAVDHADTLSSDCDYAQLSRVYGQMAQIFYEQGLYREQLNYDKLSVKYAWRGKDTLAALMSNAQIGLAYHNLKMQDSLIIVCEYVADLYKRYGYTEYAASTLGYTLNTLISNNELEKARQYMHTYESESGYFDSEGNIESGRVFYYRIKGLYFMGINNLDSAEFYFRKELREGKGFNNQHSAALGLAEFYQKLHLNDSVAKYILYAYAMSDSLYAQRTTKDVERIQAMYNYTRNQDIAHKESKRAALANRRLLFSLIVLLGILLVSSWLYIARKKLIESYEKIAKELDDIKAENNLLKQDATVNKQKINENEKRIKQLEKKLGKYGKLVYFGAERLENNLQKSSSYKIIKDIAIKGQMLSQRDWETIENLVKEYIPGFYDFMVSNFRIDSVEYKICLLLRLHFKAGEISNMLGVTPAYISKTSTEILAGTFIKKGSSKELYKELSKLY